MARLGVGSRAPRLILLAPRAPPARSLRGHRRRPPLAACRIEGAFETVIQLTAGGPVRAALGRLTDEIARAGSQRLVKRFTDVHLDREPMILSHSGSQTATPHPWRGKMNDPTIDADDLRSKTSTTWTTIETGSIDMDLYLEEPVATPERRVREGEIYYVQDDAADAGLEHRGDRQQTSGNRLAGLRTWGRPRRSRWPRSKIASWPRCPGPRSRVPASPPSDAAPRS